MKQLFLVFISITFILPVSYGQKWTSEVICSTDTFEEKPPARWMLDLNTVDSFYLVKHKMVQCETRSDIGIRLEMGVSAYYHGSKTNAWMGQHVGPNLNLIFTYDKWNIGFRFKPTTIQPKKELVFNGVTLPATAKVNNIRWDYYVGYSFDLDKLFSVEPYMGYNQTNFLVINEEELNRQFTFNQTGGLIIGTTFNKYFRLKKYSYLSVFGTAGYGFINYGKVHKDLDNGYFEWTLGVAYKAYIPNHFRKVYHPTYGRIDSLLTKAFWSKPTLGIRTGIGWQKAMFVELGLAYHQAGGDIVSPEGKGVYSSIEFMPKIWPDKPHSIVGFKGGFELGLYLMMIGAELKYLTDFSGREDVVLSPRVGLGAYTMIGLMYGYHIPVKSTFTELGNHQFSVVVNIDKLLLKGF